MSLLNSLFSAVSFLGLCLLLSRALASTNSSNSSANDVVGKREFPCSGIEEFLDVRECVRSHVFEGFTRNLSAPGVCYGNVKNKSFKFNQIFASFFSDIILNKLLILNSFCSMAISRKESCRRATLARCPECCIAEAVNVILPLMPADPTLVSLFLFKTDSNATKFFCSVFSIK